MLYLMSSIILMIMRYIVMNGEYIEMMLSMSAIINTNPGAVLMNGIRANSN